MKLKPFLIITQSLDEVTINNQNAKQVEVTFNIITRHICEVEASGMIETLLWVEINT